MEQLLADVRLPSNLKNGFTAFTRNQAGLQHFEMVRAGIVHPQLCDPIHFIVWKKQICILYKETPELSWWTAYQSIAFAV